MTAGGTVSGAAWVSAVDVFYIAFRDYGLEPLQRFLASYRRWPAECPHTLTIALKGYSGSVDAAVARELCRDVGALAIEVPDGGLDIGTYCHLAEQSCASTLCLMNSNAEILGDAWLAKLVGALDEQGGGAVSATGSWESLASDHLRPRSWRPTATLRQVWHYSRAWRDFLAFPNAHLRTNALAIARDDWLGLGMVQPAGKEAAWRFESGRRGLSGTLGRRGAALRIVGRDGRGYAPRDWDRSGTFWQGEQENLLIGDNQTQRYQNGTPALRAELRALAWQNPLRL